MPRQQGAVAWAIPNFAEEARGSGRCGLSHGPGCLYINPRGFVDEVRFPPAAHGGLPPMMGRKKKLANGRINLHGSESRKSLERQARESGAVLAQRQGWI